MIQTMKLTLKENQLRTLRGVIAKRCPELVDRVVSADISGLNREERQLLVNAIGNEFAEVGIGEDFEPTRRGLELEELLDIVNRPNLQR